MSMGQRKHHIKERRRFDEVKIKKKKNLIDDLPDENNIQALNAVDKDTKLETSYLTPDALRWMNKRRIGGSSSLAHIAPSRALQLRAIFRGLDFDGSGELSLDELKEAVQYVADADDGGAPLFHDVAKLHRFFDAMDTDNNGTVDLNEFLVGMTAEGGSKNDKDTLRLQNAFFEFGNKHRHHKIVDKIGDKNLPDIERFLELQKLFSIKYFRPETETSNVADQMKLFMAAVNAEKKELNAEGILMRKKELIRSRASSIYFNTEKENRSGLLSSFSSKSLLIPDCVTTITETQRKLIKRLQNFSLKNDSTFTPNIDSQPFVGDNIKLRAVLQSQEIKGGINKVKNVILPPVSIKNQILKRQTGGKV